MKTNTINLNVENELSYDEMSEIYGGGWIIDLIIYLEKNFQDIKKGFIDGLNNR